MPYKWGKYRIRMHKSDLAKHQDLVVGLLKQAYVEDQEN